MLRWWTVYATTNKQLKPGPLMSPPFAAVPLGMSFDQQLMMPLLTRVLIGSLLGKLFPTDLAVIAEGSLQNKAFPSNKDFGLMLLRGFKTWNKENGLPSMPKPDI